MKKWHVLLLIMGLLSILGASFLMGAATASAGPELDPPHQGKVYIPHRGGGWHLISLELLWEIQWIIISNGGLPTPGNVDAVYHEISNGF